ncbi:hypothetical protein DFJ69_4672 [Thermomonospora umbrina]|uniref:Uncharacterized protein n=1 Tax=Thermomonospora umbrina TaxID=111806 RepID=A0A3D9T1Q0_9ACTN|nr:hypothetical protein DFJ69_4672 [Thermomonospora umbrina]
MSHERVRGVWTEERAQRGTSGHVTREDAASNHPFAGVPEARP